MQYLEERLDLLGSRLLEMSRLVESAIYRGALTVVEKDEEEALKVLENEARINQIETEIDDLATYLLADDRRVSDLRFITTAIKISSDLERVSHLTVRISRCGLSLVREPIVNATIDIAHLAALVEAMIRKALDSFVKRDRDLARSVLFSDDAVTDLRDAIYSELDSFMRKDPERIRQGAEVMFVARNLARIADHAIKIAENVLFMVEEVDFHHHAHAC